MELEELAKAVETVKVMELKPGDKVVLKMATSIRSPEQAASMYELLRKVFGEAQVVILEPGMDLEIVRPS